MMSTSSNPVGAFLGTLFGSYDGDLPFVLDGEVIHTDDPAFIAENMGALRILPANREGVSFLFGSEEDTERGAWCECRLLPSAVLWRGGTSIFCWTFKYPVQIYDARIAALMGRLDMETLEEPIPLPGTDGWELIHADSMATYTLD